MWMSDNAAYTKPEDIHLYEDLSEYYVSDSNSKQMERMTEEADQDEYYVNDDLPPSDVAAGVGKQDQKKELNKEQAKDREEPNREERKEEERTEEEEEAEEEAEKQERNSYLEVW